MSNIITDYRPSDIITDFAAFSQRRYTEVDADWAGEGKKVRIQSMTERERASIERQIVREKSNEDSPSVRARIIQLTLVDAEGHRIYGEHDLDFICSLDSGLTDWLIDRIDEHCQVNRRDEERLEAAEKN